jgi:hypothetical protein
LQKYNKKVIRKNFSRKYFKKPGKKHEIFLSLSTREWPPTKPHVRTGHVRTAGAAYGGKRFLPLIFTDYGDFQS